MRADRAAADLERFLAERGEPLLRTAVLLAGSREAGEDLLQAALERLLQPAAGVAVDGTAEVDLRDSPVRLLTQLPPRQRAVIVARYWEQLTEAESARALGCSVGTVKSATSRALRRLRELSESPGPRNGPRRDRQGDKDHEHRT